MSKTIKKLRKAKFWRRWWVQVLIVLAACFILLPQLQEFIASDSKLWQLNGLLLAAGYCVFMLSTVFAALVYKALIAGKLPLGRTVIVQVAAGFANRLLPSGIGNIGLNTFYIAKQCRMKKLQAAAIATTNNVIGFAAFFIVAVLLSGTAVLPTASIAKPLQDPLPLFIVLVSVLLLLLIINGVSRWRSSIEKALHVIAHSFRLFASQPWRILPALLSSMGITLCYIAALALSAQAADLQIQLHELIIVFSASVGATAISPTPNGLGAAELAMAFALASFGYTTTESLLVVFGYRLITFWLPIIPGYMAFRFLTRRSYI